MGGILIEFENINIVNTLIKNGFETVLDYYHVPKRFVTVDDITEADLNWCSVYLAVRPAANSSASVAKYIKKSGRLYITYFDDDLQNRPGCFFWRRASVKKCLYFSDAVISPNPLLADYYAQNSIGQRAVVLDSFVDRKEIRPVCKAKGKVHFVYAASPDHAVYFKKLIGPFITDFLVQYQEHVHFTFIGVHPDIPYMGKLGNVDFIPLMTVERYNAFMSQNKFDVGIAPLEDIPFCNRKYFNKFIEYSKVGIAGIYSNCLPYTLIVEHGRNGLMVQNTADDWKRAFVYAVEHIGEMKAMAGTAQRLISTRFTEENFRKQFRDNLPEIFESNHCRKRVIWKKPRVRSLVFRLLDTWNKGIVSLKKKGAKQTAIRLLAKLRQE